jgi:hypothetical protein
MNASDVQLGVVYGMPAEQYHAIQALSNSALSALKRSPRHYWASYINPERPERVETPRMFTGTLAHCAALEPDAMAARYIVVPEDAPRRPTAAQWSAKKPSADSQAAMAWWSDFNARASGRLIVTAEQYSATQQQLAAVLAVPELAAVLASGASEVSFFWIDPETGAYCKARADHVHKLADGRVILLDLKTTSDVSPEQFGRSVWNFGYHRQDAWYSRGYEMASGTAVAAFVFGAVTSDYPHIAVPYMLDDAAKALGAEQCRDLLATYMQCKGVDYWPAYGSGVQLLSLPAWAK